MLHLEHLTEMQENDGDSGKAAQGVKDNQKIAFHAAEFSMKNKENACGRAGVLSSVKIGNAYCAGAEPSSP